MMFIKGLLAFAILATCQGFSLMRYGNLGKYVELAQALKYGNDCSWGAEEYRQNFTREKLMSGVPNMNTIMELANTIVERDYKLCSAAELFICDKESQKCVCGDPGFETVMGVNRSLYALEGTNKCRWNTNTYCVSAEHLLSQKQLGFTVDSQCKAGSTCKVGGEEGATCSIQAMVRHLLQNHGMMILFSPRRITEEIMSGRVCTCKADQVEEVEDSSENEIGSNDAAPARRKRSVSSSESSESQEAVRGKRSVSSSESSESHESLRRKRSVSSSESSESQEPVRGKRSVSSSESSESHESLRKKRSVSSSESSESQEAVRDKRSVSSSESSESNEAVRGKRSVSSSESSESQEPVRGKRSVSSSKSSESQEPARKKRSVSSSESSESKEAVRGKRSVSSSESSESQEPARGKRSISSSESSESAEFVRRKRSTLEEVGPSMLASYVTGPTIMV